MEAMIELTRLEKVQPPSDKRVAIHVTPSAQRQIRSGHPWLFDNSITKESHQGKPGDLAVIYDKKNKFLAVGIYDPLSPIRVRILQHRKSADINQTWFLTKLNQAAKLRKSIDEKVTTGYRLIHGENDSLPGLIIDKYGDTIVIKIYTPAWVPHLKDVTEAIIKTDSPKRVILRLNRITARETSYLHSLGDGDILYGDPLDGSVLFFENGIRFEADPIKGQKTGFFLDQRDNRARVEKLSKGRDVLNIYSYTGGFSLYAARGGAKSVTSVDISKEAIEACRRNFDLNRDEKEIGLAEKDYIVGDSFKTLTRLRDEHKLYDMVIIDPPALAKKESEVKGALQSYKQMVKLGLSVLRRGGVFVISSCTSRVGAEKFYPIILKSAADVDRPITEIERTGHGIDHPIGFPEGSYLNSLFAKG